MTTDDRGSHTYVRPVVVPVERTSLHKHDRVNCDPPCRGCRVLAMLGEAAHQHDMH